MPRFSASPLRITPRPNPKAPTRGTHLVHGGRQAGHGQHLVRGEAGGRRRRRRGRRRRLLLAALARLLGCRRCAARGGGVVLEGGHLVLVLHNQGHGGAHRDVAGARGRQDLGKEPLLLRLPLDRGLARAAGRGGAAAACSARAGAAAHHDCGMPAPRWLHPPHAGSCSAAPRPSRSLIGATSHNPTPPHRTPYLVGLHLAQDVARLHRVAFRLLPGHDVALRGVESWGRQA